MRRIDAYLRQSVFTLTLVVGAALLAISTFITFVTELEDLGRGQYGIGAILQYVALQIPETVYIMFPVIALLGTLMGLGALAANAELVAMRAAGVSVTRLAWGVAKAGVFVGGFAFALGEFLVPVTTPLADEIRSVARYGESARGSKDGVWLRDGRHFVFIGELVNEREIRQVELFRLADDGSLDAAIAIDTARYEDDHWAFQGVRRTEFGPDAVAVEQREVEPWPTDLTPELTPDVLRLFVLEAESLSVWGLWRYVEYLDRNGLDAESSALAFWRKLAAPVTVIVMMLVAVPFVIGSLRQGGAGQRLFVGVLFGVGFYLVNEVTSSTGLIYGLSPALTAFLPTLTVAALVGLRLRSMR